MGRRVLPTKVGLSLPRQVSILDQYLFLAEQMIETRRKDVTAVVRLTCVNLKSPHHPVRGPN
jgi:hypothetical protein